MNRSKYLKDTFTPMTKKQYLEGVKGRLANDVGTYFAMVDAEGSFAVIEDPEGNHIELWEPQA